MIENFLVNHPWLYAIAFGAYALLEWWLGRTPTTRAGSVIGLLALAIQKLFGKKEEDTVIIEKNQRVAKETAEVFAALNAIARDVKMGLKPQEVLAKDFAAVMAAIQDSDQIRVERATDPAAFAATVGAGIAQLVDVLLNGVPVEADSTPIRPVS